MKLALLALLSVSALITLPAQAQKAYGPGVTDTEIKLGGVNTNGAHQR
jgi:hypothetical protein